MMWYRNVSNIGCKWENYNVAILPTQESVNHNNDCHRYTLCIFIPRHFSHKSFLPILYQQQVKFNVLYFCLSNTISNTKPHKLHQTVEWDLCAFMNDWCILRFSAEIHHYINSKLAFEYHCVFIISNTPMTCYMSVGHMTIRIPTTAMNTERQVTDNQQWQGGGGSCCFGYECTASSY
jgi:hypothetical protein